MDPFFLKSFLGGFPAGEKLKRNRANKRKYKVSFDDAVPIAKKLLKQHIKNDKVKALLLGHLTTVDVKVWPARRMQSQTVKPLNNRA